MTSIKLPPVIEDHLTYPVVIGNRIVEMSGAEIKSRSGELHRPTTYVEWDEMMQRLENVEKLARDVEYRTRSVIQYGL